MWDVKCTVCELVDMTCFASFWMQKSHVMWFFSEALYRWHGTYAFFCLFHFANDMGVCVFWVCPTTPMSSAGTISIYLSLSLCLSVRLSIYLSICKLEKEAVLRDVLRFWTWQQQKRSNSARLPQCLKLTTSKTKQFCETFLIFELDSARNKEFCDTSSFFELDNIKNEAILRDFVQKWKVERSADSLVPLRFAIFPLHLSKVLRLPRRALFRHLNFQKWSDPGVFCTFWLRNVLRATTACTFSTSQLPKVVRTWGVFSFLTYKCASRHNGVQFFISHLASWLRTRRFSEPTLRPSGAPNHWKNTVFRGFPTFSRICIFFLLTLSLLWSALFYSSLLYASAQLCFSPVHIVGSLTSKLPSVIYLMYITQNTICPNRNP